MIEMVWICSWGIVRLAAFSVTPNSEYFSSSLEVDCDPLGSTHLPPQLTHLGQNHIPAHLNEGISPYTIW